MEAEKDGFTINLEIYGPAARPWLFCRLRLRELEQVASI